MQSKRISAPKLSALFGLSGLVVATTALDVQAQQPPPAWKQGQPANMADSKLAPHASVERIGVQLLEWHRITRVLRRVPEQRLAWHGVYAR